MKAWSQELCAEKPEELQLVAPDTYLQRKDIEEYQEPEKDGMPAHSGWKCMSREISVSEYNMLQSFAEIKADKEIMPEEVKPTQLDNIEANVTYIAMML